jgi:hypothetical protein
MRISATPEITRRRPLLAVSVVALLVLSACGAPEGEGVASAGGEENPGNPPAAEQAAPLDEDAQALVYAECMRDNGVDMPDPGPGRRGLVDALQAVARSYDRATMRLALSACEDVMPQYAQEEHTDDDWQLALAECLREEGLDVSDTPFEDAHSGAIDVNEFSAAMEECRDVLTGGGQ